MHIRHESLSISLYFLLCTETKYVQFLSNEVFHRTFFCTLNSHDVGVTAKSLCNSGRCTNVMFIRPTTVKVTKCYDFYQCTGITIWCFPRTCSCQICKMWGWTNKTANWLLNLFFFWKTALSWWFYTKIQSHILQAWIPYIPGKCWKITY